MSARETNDTQTHIVPLAEGWELVWRCDHGRVYVDVYRPKRRGVLTTALDARRGTFHAMRFGEIAAIAPTTAERR